MVFGQFKLSIEKTSQQLELHILKLKNMVISHNHFMIAVNAKSLLDEDEAICWHG